jgi:preprotein translocase subunit YajC
VTEAAAASGGGNGFTSILLLVLLFGVVYFLLIRPQSKRRREQVQMQSSIGVGDRIATIGGLHATVIAIEGDVATLEIAPGIQVEFARQAIARRLPVDEAATAEAVQDVPEPVVDEPVVHEPVVQEPVVEKPVAQTVVEPGVEQPVETPAADARKKD